LRLTTANHGQRHLGARVERADLADQRVRAGDVLTVDRDDRVVGLEPGVGRGRPVLHRADDRRVLLGAANAGGAVADGDAEVRVLDGAARDQLVGHVRGFVGWDREAQTDAAGLTAAAAVQRRDRRRHTDHLAGRIDQRTTTVTGV